MESFARLAAIHYYLATISHQPDSSKLQSSVSRAESRLFYVSLGRRRLVVLRRGRG